MMTESELNDFVTQAESIYSRRLKELLEISHKDQFVAIEPESGDYFLGQTVSEASQAARHSHPDRPTHVMRIGHATAIQLGAQ